MSAIGVLFRKELIDSLRDRRTLLMMVLLPVLLYPGLLTLVGYLSVAGKERLAREPLTVAVASADAEAILKSQPVPPHTSYQRIDRSEAERALREKKAWAVVDAPEGSERALLGGGQATVTVLYTKRHDRSAEALERIRRVLKETALGALRLRLAEANLPGTFAEPLHTAERDVDFQKNLGPLIASRLLPLMLLMMIFMGALYPAIDAVAGEKERGTLETLLAAPVHPLEVMAAKYLAVSAIAVAAALVNLFAIGLTLRAGMSLAPEVELRLSLSAGQLAVLLSCLLPSALLASGVSLAVASLARTFKDAQSLLTPVVLVPLFPGMISQMPGVELSALTAAVPFLNVALLIKATVLGSAQPLHVAMVLAWVVAGSLGAVWLSARAFQSERLRFGGADGWKSLFRLDRKREPK